MQAQIEEILNNIRIVLVATTHPGNIGATARAMKTMGLRHLVLVNPKIYPSAEVTARAAGADDILHETRVCDLLEEAIADCSMVFATSARSRNIQWPVSNPQKAAESIILAASKGNKTAIVFGRENSGLSNSELEDCNAMIQIPTNKEYSSLNLASAVQIIAYELRMFLMNDNMEQTIEDEGMAVPVTSEQMALFYQHLEGCLTDIGYYDPKKPRLLMRRLKRLFNRAQLDEEEYNIFRGIMSSVQKKVKED